MKLDRNITKPRRGKYALIKLRLSKIDPRHVKECKSQCANVQVEPGAIDFGDSDDTDFFVIRLKDKYAAAALHAYARACYEDDPEYSNEITALACKADFHPRQRIPD